MLQMYDDHHSISSECSLLQMYDDHHSISRECNMLQMYDAPSFYKQRV